MFIIQDPDHQETFKVAKKEIIQAPNNSMLWSKQAGDTTNCYKHTGIWWGFVTG